MSIDLPDSIVTFFQVSNGSAEASALRQCLDENAVVRDEGHSLESLEIH
jgi:hypothetical protein